jgi:hypothetical protein
VIILPWRYKFDGRRVPDRAGSAMRLIELK